VEADQAGNVDDPVVHVPPLRAPRHCVDQPLEQRVRAGEPARPDVDPGPADQRCPLHRRSELTGSGRPAEVEQRALEDLRHAPSVRARQTHIRHLPHGQAQLTRAPQRLPGAGGPMPWVCATDAASVRLAAPSLARMFETCTLAVLVAMNSSAPISLLLCPAASRRSTSISRSVSPARGLRAAAPPGWAPRPPAAAGADRSASRAPRAPAARAARRRPPPLPAPRP